MHHDVPSILFGAALQSAALECPLLFYCQLHKLGVGIMPKHHCVCL